MCLAIFLPPGNYITKDEVFTAASSNPDGFGFCYAANGNLESFKSLYIKEMYEEYVFSATRNLSSPFMMHFRLATHGGINKENCHPFLFDNGESKFAIVHNGIFPLTVEDGKTDSEAFGSFLEKIRGPFWDDNIINPIINKFVKDCWSKVILMLPNSRSFIFNEEAGGWDDKGRWFSNWSHKGFRKQRLLLNRNRTRGHCECGKINAILDENNQCAWCASREAETIDALVSQREP